MGNHQASQKTHYESPRRMREREGAESVFEEIMIKNFSNLRNDMHIQIQKALYKIVKIQRNSHNCTL